MTPDPLGAELLDHIEVEFGYHGKRAVEFLKTAQVLLSLNLPATPSRFPETIAYCLREALKTIPDSKVEIGAGRWREVSRAVIDCRLRYELIKDLPGEDAEGALASLLASIDELDRFHAQNGIHERRLAAIMLDRTGAAPLEAGTAPIRRYQELLGDLDRGLHGDLTMEAVCDLWLRSGALLQQLFLPPELRNAELETLASVDHPSAEEIDRVVALIVAPNHLRQFLTRIESPGWLETLTEEGLLDPPSDNGPWPVFIALRNLAPDHAPALGAWLGAIYGRDPGDPVRAWFVANAAVNLGPHARNLLLRTLKDHGTSPGVATLGINALEECAPESPFVEDIADVLLNESHWQAIRHVDPLVEALASGTQASNASKRIELLCWKLRSAADSDGHVAKRLTYERTGSIEDRPAYGSHDRFSVLLNAAVDVIAEARAVLPTDEILEILDSLPTVVRRRIRAWVLSNAPDLTVHRLIDELAIVIEGSDPVGDDLPLIDRVVAEASPTEFAEKWITALGHPPGVVEIAPRLGSRSMPKTWLRAYRWTIVLPKNATATWEQAAAVIATTYRGQSRVALETALKVEGGWVGSPVATEDLQSLPVREAVALIADWRPEESDWSASALQLARSLGTIVKTNTGPWIEAPVVIATGLRHPMYIRHYILGLTDAIKGGASVPVGQILDVIALIRAHPWDAVPIEQSSLDDEDGWSGAEEAATDVLKAIADKDFGFAGRDDEVWNMLASQARDRTAPSAIISGASDPLDSAINRRCTRALEAVISFMAYEFRSTGTVRPQAFELIEEALLLEGSDGAEHRAVIATRLGFLRHVAADWVDENAELLFGDTAPPGLAQVTADMAIKWARPNQWLHERYRPLVRSSVSRSVDNALDHLLVAMLLKATGYGVDQNIAFLRETPALLSDAGRVLARLVGHEGVDGEQIALTLKFWDAANDTKDPDSVVRFGWLADVQSVAAENWASRTLATLEVSGGRIEPAHKVAERASTLEATATTLAIMRHLIRGTSDSWDARRVIDSAVQVLQSDHGLTGTTEFKRLRTMLLERGAI